MLAPHGDVRDQVHEFALFDIGMQRIGVPIRSVVQALPYPTQITRMPRLDKTLEGVFVHRGQVVPLIHLSRWMDSGEPEAAGARQVLVLRADDKLLGIVIDGVKGLMKVRDSDIQQVHHDADAEELFHSVAFTDEHTALVSLMDPLRLAIQAKVWAADASLGSAGGSGLQSEPSVCRAATQTQTYALVRLGDTQLALPACAVGELKSGIGLQKMPGLSRSFLGMAQWRNRDLPVLDISHVLGLSQPSAVPTPWLVVLEDAGRVLGFFVSDICVVRTFDVATVQSSNLTDGVAAFCTGSCLLPSGDRVYLLHPPSLFDVSPLSKVQDASAPGQAELPRLGYTSMASSGALVVFQCRQMWAVPMAQLREIVAAGQIARQPISTDREGWVGTMEWRGQSIPMVDLRLLISGQATVVGHDARIMVIEMDTGVVGVLVESVVALIPAHTGVRSKFTASGVAVEIITVGTGAAQSSYQIINLRERVMPGQGQSRPDATPKLQN